MKYAPIRRAPEKKLGTKTTTISKVKPVNLVKQDNTKLPTSNTKSIVAKTSYDPIQTWQGRQIREASKPGTVKRDTTTIIKKKN